MISNKSVTVTHYDPQWPALFAQEAEELKQLLGDNCITIHHIGSTAVPGLAAKPIIDMIPVVKDIALVDTQKLTNHGFTCLGECGMLFRQFCTRYVGDKIPIHAHIWETGNDEIEKHLVFRDHLTSHPKAVQAYGTLKEDLAKKYPDDRLNYSLGKDQLIKDILAKTGFNGRLLVEAKIPAEWEAYHRLCPSQHLEHTHLYERHIVMSIGRTLMGYAYVAGDNPQDLKLVGFDVDENIGAPEDKAWLKKQIIRWMKILARTKS